MMAYRFNNGLGGVTCDKCKVLIDENLSYKEYKEIYDKDGKGVFCHKCKKYKKVKHDKPISH